MAALVGTAEDLQQTTDDLRTMHVECDVLAAQLDASEADVVALQKRLDSEERTTTAMVLVTP